MNKSDDCLQEMILAELRLAMQDAKSWQARVEAIGLALKHGYITPQVAIVRLRDCNISLIMDGVTGDGIVSIGEATRAA